MSDNLRSFRNSERNTPNNFQIFQKTLWDMSDKFQIFRNGVWEMSPYVLSTPRRNHCAVTIRYREKNIKPDIIYSAAINCIR